MVRLYALPIHIFFNNEQHTNMTVTVILEMCTDICHLCPELKNGTLCVSFFAILFKIASFQIFQFIKRFLIFLAFRLSFSKWDLAITIIPAIYNTAGISLLKVNKRHTRTRCELCSNLTIKAPERRLTFWCLYC